MMLKLVVCISLLTACYAQEHLTCLRTDGVSTHSNSQNLARGPQGVPGKLGPKGEVGSKGIKGEPGIPGNQQLGLFQGEFELFLIFILWVILIHIILKIFNDMLHNENLFEVKALLLNKKTEGSLKLLN